jgi:hypothetical protein
MRLLGVVLIAVSPAGVANADGGGSLGHVTFRRADGHLYRIDTQVDSSPQDISAALDALTPGGVDEWLASSADGAQLLASTQRWDPECLSWACLAVVRGDLSSGGAVHAAGAVMHAQGPGAIGRGGTIVFPMGSDDHAVDLWRLDRSGAQWSAPVRLTGASKYAYNTGPSLSPDETQVVFDCSDQPYATAGTAICGVGLDGSGLRVVLGPSGTQPEFAGAQLVAHPAYAPDGSLVFSAERGGTQVWRLASGANNPELVGSVFQNDNTPCVLPNGSIASLWYSDSQGDVLKIMLASDRTFVLPPAGDVAPDSIACGG